MLWENELKQLRTHFLTHRDHRRPNTIVELEIRGFFHMQGQKETAPIPYPQSIDDFIAGLHSRSYFTRQRMGEQRAIQFDQQVRALLLRSHSDGILPLQVVGTVVWGMPESGH